MDWMDWMEAKVVTDSICPRFGSTALLYPIRLGLLSFCLHYALCVVGCGNLLLAARLSE